MSEKNPRRTGIYSGKKTLSIMPTYTCPASCSNCGTLSGPHEGTNLPLDRILGAIRQAKQLDFYNVVFTGGETTLRWNDLLLAIAEATKVGMPTRIVTNAHWAFSPTHAREKIRDLVNSGLSEINYSTGDEHIRFIPLERVIFATVAAVEMHLPTSIMVELRKQRSVARESILEHPLIRDLAEDQRNLVNVIESPWMPLRPDRFEKYPDDIAVNRSSLASRSGCDNVLQTYTIQADGQIGCCCGLGLRLIPELNVGTANGDDSLQNAIEEAEGDFLKLWIHYKGPEKILAWAAEKNPSIKWENMYAHHCQACQRIYHDPDVIEVIRKHYREVIADVLQCAWIDEEYFPAQVKRSRPS